jgi:hypothetical protein
MFIGKLSTIAGSRTIKPKRTEPSRLMLHPPPLTGLTNQISELAGNYHGGEMLSGLISHKSNANDPNI